MGARCQQTSITYRRYVPRVRPSFCGYWSEKATRWRTGWFTLCNWASSV